LLLRPMGDRELAGRDLTPFIPKRAEIAESDADIFTVFKPKP